MFRSVLAIAVTFILLVPSGLAHDIGHAATIVVDTDMGMDDAVALALILQNPDVSVRAVVACEGAAGREKAVENLERMLALFNREDVQLYAPADIKEPLPAPPFRNFAESVVSAALTEPSDEIRKPFTPDAYASDRAKVVVLALGPLTNIAAAFENKPALKDGIAEIIVAGRPEVEQNWNLRFDPKAFERLQATGVKLRFIAADDRAALKPDAWKTGELHFGTGTSIGESFLLRLFSNPDAKQHYLERFRAFSDELTILYLADDTLFWNKDSGNTWVPNNRAALGQLFSNLVDTGRQRKERVILVSGSLPDEILQSDLRERKAQILAKNGETEWFAQLLMNELHEHLGAYSIIGVKMGLRAMELLNAPQHGMTIVSHTPGQPPFSCLNDGLIVATGCTPGRMLYRHEPNDGSKAVSAEFQYNQKRLVLTLKPEYQQHVKSKFESILSKTSLSDHEYWDEVRKFGIMIWENWHRRDMFDVSYIAPEPVAE